MFLFPNGKPLEKPGVYLIRHEATGRVYVGLSKNLFRRCKQHAYTYGGNSKLARALCKYGASSFSFVPLYYAFDTDNLEDVEQEMISLWDSANSGFNIQERSRGYGYGEQFSEKIRMALNREEVKENRRNTNAKEETKQRRSEARRKIISSPQWSDESRKRVAVAVKTIWQNDEMRKSRSEAMRNKTQERVAKLKTTLAANPKILEKRAHVTKASWENATVRDKRMSSLREACKNPERARKIGEATKLRFSDPVKLEEHKQATRIYAERKKRAADFLGIPFRNVTKTMIEEYENC